MTEYTNRNSLFHVEQLVTKHATKVDTWKFWQLNHGIREFQDLVQFTYIWRIVFCASTDISRYRIVHSVASGIVFVTVI